MTKFNKEVDSHLVFLRGYDVIRKEREDRGGDLSVIVKESLKLFRGLKLISNL